MHTFCPPPLCQAVEALDSLSSCEKRDLCLRGWREFHLFLSIFGWEGSSLGGIIYCFQAPTGFITYSSYYSVELWRTHQDSFRWRNTERGRTIEVGKKRGRRRQGGEARRRDRRGGAKGRKKCRRTQRRRRNGHLFLFIYNIPNICLKLVIVIRSQSWNPKFDSCN